MSSPSAPEPAGAGSRGRLFLVPAPLDFSSDPPAPLESMLPDATLAIAAQLKHWICENAKSTRAYLKRVHAIHPLQHAMQDMQLVELPREIHKKGDHDGRFDARPLLTDALQNGHDIGLVSEAGMPAIADPGSSVVRAAHRLGLEVVPLAGPVSLMLALAASGLNGQDFAFTGYLPQEAAARAKAIQDLEARVLRTGQTQLFIETPYRNATLMQALVQALKGDTLLAVGSALGLAQARTRTASIAQWRAGGWLPPNNLPAVFAIGR